MSQLPFPVYILLHSLRSGWLRWVTSLQTSFHLAVGLGTAYVCFGFVSVYKQKRSLMQEGVESGRERSGIVAVSVYSRTSETAWISIRC